MQGLTGRLAARGYEGAVATGHPLATRAGIDMLRAGGNATDAAVAAAATMVVAAPHLSHLGGDLFLLHYDGATGEVTALNASGAAPRRATLDRTPMGASVFAVSAPRRYPGSWAAGISPFDSSGRGTGRRSSPRPLPMPSSASPWAATSRQPSGPMRTP